MSADDIIPCLDCGACCKSYRVSFYWAEAPERGLPEAMTERVTPHVSCMKGTNAAQPHCVALGKGDAGPMACGVYAQRPAACREVQIGDEKCNRARARHGLPGLAALLPGQIYSKPSDFSAAVPSGTRLAAAASSVTSTLSANG